MRRMKSSPICMLICCRDRLILPVVAICVGMSLHVSTVEAMSSSKRDVYGRGSLVRYKHSLVRYGWIDAAR